jgi:shikimate dehydrogenase
MSKPYAEVIGDPIGHSKSPLIHGFWLEKLGIDAEYRACHVRPEELADYFTRRREDADWRGCNVTIPHKISVLDFVDECDSSVENVGAANCVVPKDGKLGAWNTDTSGVDSALPYPHNSVCIIGAGGAARAAFPSLDVMCVRDIRILVRDPVKAARSFSDLKYDFHFFPLEEAEKAMRDVDGVINASPLGMTGKEPMPRSILDALRFADPQAYVFDMVYSPLETDLLKTAKASGREAIDGLTMLIGQAGGAFLHFFGRWPDPEGVYDAELRAKLTS